MNFIFSDLFFLLQFVLVYGNDIPLDIYEYLWEWEATPNFVRTEAYIDGRGMFLTKKKNTKLWILWAIWKYPAKVKVYPIQVLLRQIPKIPIAIPVTPKQGEAGWKVI